MKHEMNEKCQLRHYIYSTFALIATDFFLSMVCRVERYDQSHTFLLSLRMQCPIRGILSRHHRERRSCSVHALSAVLSHQKHQSAEKM